MADADIKKLKDAFLNNQIKGSLLCEVICERTNLHLQELQEVYAKETGDSTRGAHNQPVALTKFVSEKIEAAKTVTWRKEIREFVTRALLDPYVRGDPSERDTSSAVDKTRAAADAEKLRALSAEVFLSVFLGESGSMNFSQIRATVAEFEEDEFIGEIEDTFLSPFQDLCVKYIEYATQ
jgi:hypothetical protein